MFERLEIYPLSDKETFGVTVWEDQLGILGGIGCPGSEDDDLALFHFLRENHHRCQNPYQTAATHALLAHGCIRVLRGKENEERLVLSDFEKLTCTNHLPTGVPCFNFLVGMWP